MDQKKDFSGRVTFPVAPLMAASLLTSYLLMAIIEVAKDSFHHKINGKVVTYLLSFPR